MHLGEVNCFASTTRETESTFFAHFVFLVDGSERSKDIMLFLEPLLELNPIPFKPSLHVVIILSFDN